MLILDVGLTHAKAHLATLDEGLFASAVHGYRTHRRAPALAEQDPDEWWAALTAGVAELHEREPEALTSIVGIGVTGHMHALVCLDRQGAALGNALILGDLRAIEDAAAIEDAVSIERAYHATGARLDASIPAAKWRWLQRHGDARATGASLITSVKDAIRNRLTGDRLTEPIDACASSFYDIRKRRWSPELMEAARMPSSLLPDVVEPDCIAGLLRSEAAGQLGVPSGIPVAVSAGDDVEVIGAGLLEHGEALEHLGTTGSILAVASEPVEDPAMTLELYPHVLPGRWVAGGSTTAAGAAVAWLAQLLGVRDFLTLLDWSEDVDIDGRRGAAGSVLRFLPALAGERCPVRDPLARGILSGLGVSTTRGLIARAVFDGVDWSLRRILFAMDEAMGPIAHLVVSAGPLGSDRRWLQRRADGYRRPLRLLSSGEPTAVGTAAIVAAAVGLVPDIRSAVGQLVCVDSDVEPWHDNAAGPATAQVEEFDGELTELSERASTTWASLATSRDTEHE